MPYIGVSPQFGVRRKHTYTATAGQTSFSGAGSEGATLSYKDSNFVDVYQNGVKLGDSDYTSTSGTAIVLAQGASVDDLIEIIVFDAFSAADTVSKADGGQFDGDVTFAGAFTSQGIDDNANATAITIDSSENVMINTTNTNPAEGNVVGVSLMASNAISACDDGSAPIQLNRKTDDGAIAILRKDGSAIGSIGSDGSDLFIDSSVSNHAGLRFAGGSVLPRYNGSLADNAVDLGQASTDYRFKDLYLSGGVFLGGTGSANKISDFEQGTWTPTNGGNTTYGSREGLYIKAGNAVFIFGIMEVASIGTGSTQVISGLPFASTRECTIPLSKLEHSSFNFYSAQLRTSGSTLYLSAQTSLDAHIAVNQNYFQNSTVVQFSGTYITS